MQTDSNVHKVKLRRTTYRSSYISDYITCSTRSPTASHKKRTKCIVTQFIYISQANYDH